MAFDRVAGDGRDGRGVKADDRDRGRDGDVPTWLKRIPDPKSARAEAVRERRAPLPASLPGEEERPTLIGSTAAAATATRPAAESEPAVETAPTAAPRRETRPAFGDDVEAALSRDRKSVV